MSEESQEAARPPTFPNYPKPQGIPLCHPKQQGPLMKMLGKLIAKPRTPQSRGRSRGLISKSSIHITKRKQKWY
jgi:hypothetical protein